MAQFLVRAKDQPVEVAFDGRFFGRRGDLVGAFPDDHEFSVNEDKRKWIAAGRKQQDWPGDYVIVKVVGLSLEKAKKAIRRHFRAAVSGQDPEFDFPDPGDQKVLVAKHAWRVLVSEVANDFPNWTNKLMNDGYNEADVSVVGPYVREILSERTLNNL